ncbi:hypothetical protein TVAG_192560 [Trichomonas vaginalis G3]|uniref:Uncharacterized protein n=1 Tax=Trichomonas vaginalis (strain ATCC PRA-98 / G3) TaxID=412133 RepID=A2DGX0_TRIV3|nr:hypothetical protein TVAGG3_0319000 [Trichomonas vaginalis G3]EAY20280.1 hypothetical protein TVAG_192560 [Trichomonas vaginalis G3]KAI5529152.1 hypothetical protein TVAGG3_0319000 [Trichomonas vaginalis G3]|eukprot:XP_001581266.1 hypothetical protein [Trichomonas vaginalis G3]
MHAVDYSRVSKRIEENEKQGENVKTVDQILDQQTQTALLISEIRFLRNQIVIMRKLFNTDRSIEDIPIESEISERNSSNSRKKPEQKYIERKHLEAAVKSYQDTRNRQVEVVINDSKKSFAGN